MLETRFLRPIPSSERVAVGIDRDGAPVSIEVVQQLVVVRRGDYTFAVIGPVRDVERAPGSESDPGLRRDAVLWAGFSPGRRVLAARVTLDVDRARAVLPLRVTVSRDDGRATLRLQNVTAVRVPAFEADARRTSVVRALDMTRAAAKGDGPLPDAFADARGRVRTILVTTAAPLRVTGRFGSKAISTVLGDGRPLQFEVSLHAVRVPHVRLRVDPVPPIRGLTPPSGKTWAGANRLSGRALLARAVATRLEFARARQYDQFLAVPDQAATARAVFEYRTVSRAASPTPAPRAADEGASTALKLVVALAAAVLLAGGVIWWAYS